MTKVVSLVANDHFSNEILSIMPLNNSVYISSIENGKKSFLKQWSDRHAQ